MAVGNKYFKQKEITGRGVCVNSTAREGLSEEVKLNRAGRAIQVERHDCRLLGQCLWSARSRREGKGGVWEVAGEGHSSRGASELQKIWWEFITWFERRVTGFL